MTIEQIMTEMQHATRGFSAGASSAKQAADSLRSLGRSAALAGLCMLPSLARQISKAHEEYEAKLAAARLEAHRGTTSQHGRK